jgi:hypothetical protein
MGPINYEARAEECMDYPDPDDGGHRGLVVTAGDLKYRHALSHGRSLSTPAGFTVADEPLQNNFAKSTTQTSCTCSCGDFGPAITSPTGLCVGAFGIVDDLLDNDDDFFVFGLDGSGGGIFLTSTSALPLCPSKVKFDFYFVNALSFGVMPRTLELQVYDPIGDTILFSKPVLSATLAGLGAPITTATVIGEEIVLSDPLLFNSCTVGAKLRFAWDIPESLTGPALFVLDNVFVTPLALPVSTLELVRD